MNRYGVVGALMLVVGVALFGGGAYVALQQEAGLAEIETANGTVASASLEPAGSDRFYPNVTYTYAVGGENYTSNRIFPDDERRPSPRGDAAEVVGRYRAGQTVTVYYPPDEPDRSSLRAPRSPTPIFAVGFGFVIFMFGLLFSVAGRQDGTDPIETDEVTLVDREPTPRSEVDDGGEERAEGSDESDRDSDGSDGTDGNGDGSDEADGSGGADGDGPTDDDRE